MINCSWICLLYFRFVSSSQILSGLIQRDNYYFFESIKFAAHHHAGQQWWYYSDWCSRSLHDKLLMTLLVLWFVSLSQIFSGLIQRDNFYFFDKSFYFFDKVLVESSRYQSWIWIGLFSSDCNHRTTRSFVRLVACETFCNVCWFWFRANMSNFELEFPGNCSSSRWFNFFLLFWKIAHKSKSYECFFQPSCFSHDHSREARCGFRLVHVFVNYVILPDIFSSSWTVVERFGIIFCSTPK